MSPCTLAGTASVTYSTNSYDGANPRGELVLAGNTLYGTTSEHAGAFGGAWGTIFKVDVTGSNFAVLHYFSPVSYPYPTNSDGGGPQAGLVLCGKTLYGTASAGGASGGGTVFKIQTDGSGFAVLHSFAGDDPPKVEGARPMARLTLSGRTLYGTTQRGGYNGGTVFKLNTDGSGFTTLHAFGALTGRDLTNSGGAFPETELLVSGNTLYGTAWSGGPWGCGTVFKLNTDGTDFTILHGFKGDRSDHYNDHAGLCNEEGAYPESGLALSGKTLYGTAHAGGPAGHGTIFRVRTDGSGFTVLRSFTAHGNGAPDNLKDDGEQAHALIEQLRWQVEQLKKQLYGPSSERQLDER